MRPPRARFAVWGLLAAAAAAAAAPPPVSYRIDPSRAEAGFELGATLHTVHGRTSAVSGEVRVSGALGGPLDLSGRIEIGVAALGTGNASRDRDMHETSLDAARFPSIVFAPSRFVPAGPADPSGTVRGSLTGDLTIRGVTRPATMDATLSRDGERVAAKGTFDVTWAEYGVPDPSKLFLHVAKVAHARFEAVFVPEAPGRP